MFSDHGRILKILLLGGFLAAASLYAQFSFKQLTYRQCLVAPAGYDGSIVMVSRDVTIGRIEPDRFWVDGYEGEFPIEVPEGTENLELGSGDYFQAITIFHRRGEGGYLELKEIVTAPLRRLKIVVSILPVLLVAILLSRSLRWKSGRLVLLDPEVRSEQKGGFHA